LPNLRKAVGVVRHNKPNLFLKKFIHIISVSLSLIITSCSNNQNYKEAYGYEEEGRVFIKLKGKRELAAHDIGALLSKKTYEDSLLIQVPSLRNGIVAGKEIPVQKGYYNYIGDLTIQSDKVLVNLRYQNTDEGKTEPLSWNGKYVLKLQKPTTAK
jgi:hypothetical protein